MAQQGIAGSGATRSEENGAPRWLVPTDSAALAECRNLKLSEILDRVEELEKARQRADHGSDEFKRASIMLKAAHTVMMRGEYRKVAP
jgi:hypothetical protein